MSTSEPIERESEGEELVAYLDGELPADSSRRIEARLANDSDYRQQLRELDQAWEALDALPRPVADDDFARTTIEMVAQKAQLDLSERVAEVAQVERRNHLRWIAAALMAAAASFAIAGLFITNPDKRLLDNLPVIRQSDLLNEISDITFLEALAKEVSIDQLVRYKEDFDRDVKAIEGASAPSPAAREVWVKSQTEEQQQSLFAQQTRFYSDYDDKGRERLTSLYTSIAAHPEKEKLEQYLVAYGQWLVGRGESLKLELRDATIPVSDRVSRVESVVERDLMESARRLSDDERTRMRQEIGDIAAEHRDEVEAFFSQEQSPIPGFDERVWDEHRAKLLKFLEAGGAPSELLVVTWALMNPETMESTRARLVEQLDASSREFLEPREGDRRGGPRGGGRGNMLTRWITETMIVVRGSIGEDELRDFFASKNNLSPEQKQRLLMSPRSDFEAEVRNLLIEQQNGIRELSQLMGIDTGRGGGPRGGRGGGPNQGGRGGMGRGPGGPFGPEFEGPGGPPMPGGGLGPPGFGPPPDGKRDEKRDGNN